MKLTHQFKRIDKHYPFEKWHAYFNDGLEQYTRENCDKAQKIIEELITALLDLGLDVPEKYKARQFEIAVKKFNDLNKENDFCLIESGEREDLVLLFQELARVCDIDTANYGDGNDITSKWREW